MKLLCVGGGSGGHVTPVLAVINELAKLDSDLSVDFVTDKAFLEQTKGLVEYTTVPVRVHTITAGKFRRYMDVALWKQVLRPDIGGRNLVDMFKIAGGVAQGLALLRKVKPDVVFAKGGYVSLPIGYAAHTLRIPLVIHDSDARPGLTNRVLSRWAGRIATGMPVKNYRYNTEITEYTGVPVSTAFHRYTPSEQKATKEHFGVAPDKPLVVATGGGLGAREINDALVAIAPELLSKGYGVYHVTGRAPFERIKGEAIETADYKVVPFLYEGLAQLYGAADVVVTRASATTLQELAAAERAAIIVPNSSLGDQLENAKVYESDGAAIVLRDEELLEDPSVLTQAIETVLGDDTRRRHLADTIAKYAKPAAAERVAKLIFEAKK